MIKIGTTVLTRVYLRTTLADVPLSRLLRTLATTTPIDVLGPQLSKDEFGRSLDSAHESLRADLLDPQVIKVGRNRVVRALTDGASVAPVIDRLQRLQPAGSDIAVNLFDQQPGPALENWQTAVLQSWFTAATAMATTLRGDDSFDDTVIDEIVRLGSSATAAGAIVRDRFGHWGWGPVPLPDVLPGVPGVFGLPPGLEELLIKGEALRRSGCGRAAAAAVRGWATAMSENSPRYFVNSITSLDPDNGCAGSECAIIGSGFGDGTRGAVVFSGLGGAPVLVQPRGIRSWADDRIVVVIPAAARRGPVGVVMFPEPTGASIVDAGSTAVGELQQCFGPAAMTRLTDVIDGLSVPVLGSPPRQNDNANMFVGGPPIITFFTATPGRQLVPGQSIRLAWQVEGADHVEIVTAPVAGSAAHELPPVRGALDPTGGTVTVTVPGTRRWQGLYVLRASNACTGPTTPEEAVLPMEMALRQGLALGGGGTRGDFQVGALLYLYDERGFRPDAIASTSVGSVNAIDLVMGDDPGRSAAQRLRENWLVLRANSDMWTDEPWLSNVKASTRAMIRSFSLEGLLALPYVIGVVGSGFNEIKRALVGSGPTALFNMNPIEARIRAVFDPTRVAASGIRLRLVVVSVGTGEVVHVTETGQVIETMPGRPPLLNPAVGPAPPPDPVDGVVASSAMPGIFPARRVGNHSGVDGGVRDVVPVLAAVRNLGCNRVIAIRCSAPPVIEPLDPGRPFPSVMTRSLLGLTFDEVADDDVAPFAGWGPGVDVTVIQPSFDLHDPMVVDPGLIRIAMDYGWMRAADVLDPGVTDRSRAAALCDEIVQLRVENWRLAHAADGGRVEDPHRSFTSFLLRGVSPSQPSRIVPVPDPAAVDQVRANGVVIRQRILDRLGVGGPCPAWRNDWFLQWEDFNAAGGAPLMPDPWASFISRAPNGTRPAIPPPATV